MLELGSIGAWIEEALKLVREDEEIRAELQRRRCGEACAAPADPEPAQQQ